MSKQYFNDNANRIAVYAYGECAIVLEYDAIEEYTQTEILRCQNKLYRLAEKCRVLVEVISAVPGYLNITLRFDPLKTDFTTLQSTLIKHCQATCNIPLAAKNVSPALEISVRYGGQNGPDLQYVADFHKMSCNEVIALHSGADYHVLFNGFLPGFAYLHGLPDKLHTPRQSAPRISINAGAVGIGGSQTGIYPCKSPGGWQIIGQIGNEHLPLFNPDSAQPLTLPAGTRLRFKPV